MNQELISVIVPVYNVERYLAACLDSILTQSYQNIEVIVINDGSTDFSLNIAETYAKQDDRIKVYNFENEGLSEARNRGLNVATGDLVTFVDSDDLMLPKALEVLSKLLIKYSLDIIEGEILHNDTPETIKYKKEIQTQIFSPHEAIENVLYQKKMLPSACGKLYRTRLFETLRFKKGIFYEDLDFFYRIFEKAQRIGYADFPVYFYRNNEKSIINSWKPHRLDVLTVTEELEQYISENYPDLLPAAKDRRLSANFNMFALCSIHGDIDKANECWNHILANRKKALINSKVRWKNRMGILLSYFGKNIFKIISNRFYKGL